MHGEAAAPILEDMRTRMHKPEVSYIFSKTAGIIDDTTVEMQSFAKLLKQAQARTALYAAIKKVENV